MNIDDITIGDAKRLVTILGPSSPTLPEAHPYPVGENVFIRSVTYHYTGKLVRVTANELVITDAAWIGNSGRFAAALASGTLDEVEPYPDGDVVVPRSCVTDVCRWLHPLPRIAK